MVAYAKAIEIDPNFAMVYFNLANVYRDLDNYQAARLNLQQAFKLPYRINAEVMGFYNSRRLAGANQFELIEPFQVFVEEIILALLLATETHPPLLDTVKE